RQCAARPAASDDQHVGRVAGRPRCRQRHLREYRTTCRPWRLLLVLLVLLVLLALGERPLVMLVLLVRLLPGREVTVSVRSIPSHGVLPSPFGLVCARNVTPPNRTSGSRPFSTGRTPCRAPPHPSEVATPCLSPSSRGDPLPPSRSPPPARPHSPHRATWSRRRWGGSPERRGRPPGTASGSRCGPSRHRP